ncbi:MAG: hypothetical protein WBD40_16120 [Tepidisphaeraceae bacterium]
MAKRSVASSKSSVAAPVRMLFIGNSFTARNDLPGLIAQLAIAPDGTGHAIQHQLIQRGGASLRMHLNKGDAAVAIQGGRYDFVVLQEQSTLPIKNAARMHENVRAFDALIRAAGSRTVLYMTWARKTAPPEAQQQIADAYTSVGKEIGAIVVPAGLAWRAYLAKHKAPPLHDADQSHPTLAGSYLAACTFHAALFGAAPVGEAREAGKLDPAHREALAKIAVEVVKLRVSS